MEKKNDQNVPNICGLLKCFAWGSDIDGLSREFIACGVIICAISSLIALAGQLTVQKYLWSSIIFVEWPLL